MLSRFEKADIEKSLSSFQDSNAYGDLSFADLERIANEYCIVQTHIQLKEWFQVDHYYYHSTCEEIKESFIDSRECNYTPSPTEGSFKNNTKNPQSEFAGFLFKFVA